MNVAVELAPQKTPFTGSEVAVCKTSASKTSTKVISVAVDVGLVFVIVNSSFTESPAPRGPGRPVVASKNSLVRVGIGLTERTSVAVLPTTPTPSMVAVIAPVVLVKSPAEAGTDRVTLKLQEASGASVPPENVRKVSPA